MAMPKLLKAEEKEIIKLNLFIPKELNEQHQIVMFRLRNKELGFIGVPLIAFIKVVNLYSKEEDKKKRRRKS